MAIDTTEYLVDQLIRSVKRRAYMPTNDATFSSPDMLEVLNEEMRDYVVPFLRDVHEEYMVRTLDLVVAVGVTNVRIPPRCAAEALKAVMHDPTGTGNYVPMSRVEPQLSMNISGRAYFVEDDHLVLTEAPTAPLTLRLKYLYRPNTMVLSSSCAKITSLSATFAFPNFGTIGQYCDIVAGQPGFRTLVLDALINDNTSGTEFDVNVEEQCAIGDWMAPAGTSPFPQIPVEAWGLLAQRAAVKLLEGKGSENYDKAQAELEGTPNNPGGLRARVLSALSNRTETSPKYIQNYDAPGWARGPRMRRST